MAEAGAERPSSAAVRWLHVEVGPNAITLYGDLPNLVEFNVGFCKKINDQASGCV